MNQVIDIAQNSSGKPVKVIAVTGGKGGVGKTNVSVNLSVALSQLGHKVMLLDADLGLANVDVMLGLKSERNLSHVLRGDCELKDIVVHGPHGLQIVPASSGTQNMAELSAREHAGIIQAFSDIGQNLDFLIVDTAAGITDMVVSFTRAAQDVLTVVCDEPTSITDAYALMKVLNRDHRIGKFHVLANMVHTSQEGRELFAKLSGVCNRFLDVTLDYLGSIPSDENVRKAVKKQKALVEAFPRSPASIAIKSLAKKVQQWPPPRDASGHIEFFMERLVSGAS
ncbi:MinD/ParA family protein [Aliikangiella sp. G2MR2-5]|uniref:MinD/ParA family protein n=1 Tax=Aliikangiella sp. G2MR2-5 TaxID=2788943 RepID=UPI001AEE109E|nr:MinD/ParA family protein [Aliikangiella sp. G2MR2-5]